MIMAILVEYSTNIAIIEHSHRKMSLFGIFKTQHGRDKSLQQWFCLLKIDKSEELFVPRNVVNWGSNAIFVGCIRSFSIFINSGF